MTEVNGEVLDYTDGMDNAGTGSVSSVRVIVFACRH